MGRDLIVNADDFGASRGTDRGIAQAHEKGIVTSASLMVNRPAAREAGEPVSVHPQLSVGLHFDAPDRPDFDRCERVSLEPELKRQLERFHDMVQRDPTHVDSHHHVHREPGAVELFSELLAPLGVPLRTLTDPRVRHTLGELDIELCSNGQYRALANDAD